MKIFSTLILAGCALLTFAQQPASTQEAIDTFEEAAQIVPAPLKFSQGSFAGFRFDLPEGALVEQTDNSYIAKYPDGSFGVSMMRTDAKASNQKRATAVVQGLAKSMHLSGSSVRQVEVNGLKGAVATGTVEGSDVSVAILVYGGKELQLVAMSSPEHAGWTAQLLKTIHR